MSTPGGNITLIPPQVTVIFQILLLYFKIPRLTVHSLFISQWIQCDLRYLDFSVIGKFSVVMADPPWDIHMEVVIEFVF